MTNQLKSKSMKKIINISRWMFLLGFFILFAASCNKGDDKMTKHAQVGGLIEPTASFFYKLGKTTEVFVGINIPSGPAISQIMIYNKFVNNDGTESNEVLFRTITVTGSTDTIGFTYLDLRNSLLLNGVPLPAADTSLPIGSSFVLRYEVKMEADGRKVVNLATTTIGISNFFAGKYHCTGVFHHPVNGDRPINEDKDLIAINAFQCTTSVGDLAGNDYYMIVTIDPTTFLATVSPIHASPPLVMTTDKVSKLDPATGIISLYYFYVGATGNRVIEETYTPIP
jgi:hypothetical protein